MLLTPGRRALLGLLLVAAGGPAAAQSQPPYRDPNAPVFQRVRDLLGRMTLEEKFWQLFMLPGDLDDPAQDWSHGVFGLQISTTGASASEHTARINAIQRFFVERTRLGIPIIPFDEAVHGLVREGATMFPQAIALAASWDTVLLGKVARAIAHETRSRGIRQVLSPVVNLASDVRWGRVEETYGEDSYFVARFGTSFVAAFEQAGVIATPKHFVANVGEGGRDSYPIELSRRALEEQHFPPFAAAIREAHARAIMTAYNSVDGSPATQNRWLLTDQLKRAWGFSGFVISDAAATGGATVLHRTEPNTAAAARDAWEAGLDVVFQSSYPQHRPYLDAVRRGLVSQPVIDSAVARVLRAKFELGLFEHPYAVPDSAAVWNGHAAHRALALEAARAGIVLLKNQHDVLPLKPALGTLAVVGADAAEARLGGYSGPGIERVSILDGLRSRLGAARVRFAPGPGRLSAEYTTVPPANLGSEQNGAAVAGLAGEYFDNPRLEGTPRVRRTDPRIDFLWTLSGPAPGVASDWYSVRWTGTLTAPPGGIRRLGVEGTDGFRLYLDDTLLVDNWTKQSYHALLADAALEPGTRHALRLEYFETTGNAHLKLIWDAGPPSAWQAELDSAVAVARSGDAVVVVAGIEEGEFRDRAFLGLPGHQEELILRIAATGKPVVVVLVGGSAVTMSRWLHRVAGVLDVWYPGEQGGTAVAEVLFGDYNPAGRLPVTFPQAEGQLPLRYDHKPTGRGDDYWDLSGRPLFPFGFGLSYTRFAYSDLQVVPDTQSAGRGVTVRLRVSNVGPRAGDEVVQLYLRDLLASVARPVLQLAGFARVHLEPGASREVAFPVAAEQLQLLDRDLHRVSEPGTVRVLVGASSTDIRLRGELVVR